MSWHSGGGTATSSVRPPSPPNPRQESEREHVRNWRKRLLNIHSLGVFFLNFFYIRIGESEVGPRSQQGISARTD